MNDQGVFMKAVLAAVVGIAMLPSLAAAAEPKPSRAAPKAAAPATPGTQAPPSAARDLSRALLTSDEWEKLLDRYSASLGGQLTQSLQAQKEPVPSDLQGSLRKKLGEKLPYENAVDAQAKALANHFSAEELRQAAIFYSSPVGKKVLAELPQALGELGDELQGQLASTVPEIVAQVAPKAFGPGTDHGAGTGSGAPSPDASAPEQGQKPPAAPNGKGEVK